VIVTGAAAYGVFFTACLGAAWVTSHSTHLLLDWWNSDAAFEAIPEALSMRVILTLVTDLFRIKVINYCFRKATL
jgi:hypothetical protein